ncbi:hypothetical protein SISNIDRAFT_464730 [Sistotremastrum niveocremeum HHB9708]|uniref:Uncharacterized protein n=1 Tax=Sistotremastrum niveocremeum HHB9708 TaxID=1314777 RepID=A0A164WI10_9AGAM|nr:hypothetical protein SISNIDRAFT_464730 [Sistotremastrum niveocremeum HHB9708]
MFVRLRLHQIELFLGVILLMVLRRRIVGSIAVDYHRVTVDLGAIRVKTRRHTISCTETYPRGDSTDVINVVDIDPCNEWHKLDVFSPVIHAKDIVSISQREKAQVGSRRLAIIVINIIRVYNIIYCHFLATKV